MAWSTMRKATDDDRQRLASAAERFCRRHGINTWGDPEGAIDNATHCPEADQTGRASRLARLWRRIVKRALRSNDAEGIAYGYVGYSVE